MFVVIRIIKTVHGGEDIALVDDGASAHVTIGLEVDLVGILVLG